jgi:hypothetical protein
VRRVESGGSGIPPRREDRFQDRGLFWRHFYKKGCAIMPTGFQVMPPPDPNAAVIAIIRLFATIAASLLGSIIALLGVIFWLTDARLKSLEEHFQTAIVADAEVKQMLNESPDLKKTINETHDAVKKLETSIELLKPLETHDAIIDLQKSMAPLKPVPQQVQRIETNQEKMQMQLDSIQKQVHAPK